MINLILLCAVILVLGIVVSVIIEVKRPSQNILDNPCYRKRLHDKIKREYKKMNPVCPYCGYKYPNILIHHPPKTCPKCGADFSRAERES